MTGGSEQGGRALSCVACGANLENVSGARRNQPFGGLSFTSFGHYGSTVFDPLDGSFLEINVCDSCLINAARAGRVYLGRECRPVVADTRFGSLLVGWESVDRSMVPWDGLSPDEDLLEVDVDEVGDERPGVEWVLTRSQLRALESGPVEGDGGREDVGRGTSGQDETPSGPWGVLVRSADGSILYVAMSFPSLDKARRWISVEQDVSPGRRFEPVMLMDAHEMRAL